MVEAKVVVKSRVGLHARPAAAFVRAASGFASRVTLEADRKTANGKSILQVLSLGAKSGHTVVIRAEGDDEADAVTCLARLVSGEAESDR